MWSNAKHTFKLNITCMAVYLKVSYLQNASGSLYQKTPNHINVIAKIANEKLDFLKRNIRVHNRDLKSTAYETLFRPKLEYASTVWSPNTDLDINKIESFIPSESA